jgi:uncharacterized membrane protein
MLLVAPNFVGAMSGVYIMLCLLKVAKYVFNIQIVKFLLYHPFAGVYNLIDFARQGEL